jgi:hypothetical protein
MEKLLSTAEVRQIITDEINRNKEDFRRHLIISEYLDTKKGKLANGVSFRKLPEHCKYVHKYGMNYIYFNDGTRETQHLVTHGELIGTIPFIEKDASHGIGASERIDKLEESLNDEYINSVAKLQNERANAINTLFSVEKQIKDGKHDGYHFPAHYDVFRISDESKNSLRRI